jgi:hypothetical protein
MNTVGLSEQPSYFMFLAAALSQNNHSKDTQHSFKSYLCSMQCVPLAPLFPD